MVYEPPVAWVTGGRRAVIKPAHLAPAFTLRAADGDQRRRGCHPTRNRLTQPSLAPGQRKAWRCWGRGESGLFCTIGLTPPRGTLIRCYLGATGDPKWTSRGGPVVNPRASPAGGGFLRLSEYKPPGMALRDLPAVSLVSGKARLATPTGGPRGANSLGLNRGEPLGAQRHPSLPISPSSPQARGGG